MDYSELGKILQEARLSLGLKQSDIASKIGCTPANISSWERGKSKIDIDSFAELCSIYRLDFAKILEDLNDKDAIREDRLTANEQEHIKKFRTLDGYGKKTVNCVLNIEYERCHFENTIIQVSFELPMSEYAASAGTGNWLDEEYTSRVKVLDTPQARKANLVIKVSGDSMEPLYSDGDLVLVRIQPDVELGEIGIFIVNNEGYIKKKGSGELISVNPEYDNIEIKESTDYRCFGKVLGKAETVS